MNSILSRQPIVVICFVVILCIMLSVAVLLILGSISGAHSSQTSIMLIAPPYQIV